MHTEEQLLQELAAGSRSAAEKIYGQHYNTVTRWMAGQGAGEEDAADIFQEGMVVLFEKSKHSDFRLSCRIGTYLFSVCKHLWYKRAGRLQRGPVLMPDSAGTDEGRDWAYEDDLNAHAEREAHYRNLDDAMASLGEPCSSLLKAYYHEDLSMQQIAERYSYTNAENAKTQKYKCLSRLKKIFFAVGA